MRGLMFEQLAIPGVFVFTPKRLSDERGYFVETFNRALLEPMTGPIDWVQDNQSRSRLKGTLRGLHFQIAPFAQDKLIRCLSGSILDVAVDLRAGSPTFGHHVKAVLTATHGRQMFVPRGCAHGFITLEDNCEVAYKVSAYYSGPHERGVKWDDPDLAIDWGVAHEPPILSPKDAAAPPLAAASSYFTQGA